MDEAIDLEIEGRSPYPEAASFIDDDRPELERLIQRAHKNGYSAVLVSPDGSFQIVPAPPRTKPQPLPRP